MTNGAASTRARGSAGAVVAFAAAALVSTTAAAQDQTYDFRSDDPVMNEAMERARESLPRLFAALDTGVAADFPLKVAVDASDVDLTL
ncbi:MAG: hypothetical protein AAFU55_14855, partial [Pseudomonadota bacterium]